MSQLASSDPTTPAKLDDCKSEKKDQNGTKSSNAKDRQFLVDYVERMQTVQKAQDAARSLREKAEIVTDAEERERLVKEAYAKETEAHGLSKLAQRMGSGTWQGLAGGAGIGGLVSVGLGTVVGTVVTGVLSIPTVGLGALIGSGVGALHGPFIKLNGGKEKKNWKDVPPEEVVSAFEEGRLVEEEDGEEEDGEGKSQPVVTSGPDLVVMPNVGKKKPRKLEVRSQRAKGMARTGSSDQVTRTMEPRRPRKIEVRSASKGVLTETG